MNGQMKPATGFLYLILPSPRKSKQLLSGGRDMVKRLLDDFAIAGIGDRLDCFTGVMVGGRVSPGVFCWLRGHAWFSFFSQGFFVWSELGRKGVFSTCV